LHTAHSTLNELKKKALSEKRKRLSEITARIIVGTATCGVAAGANAVVEALKQEVEARKLDGVVVTETGCSGRCDLEPLVQVLKHGEPPALYYHVSPEKARRIVQQHIQNNEIIQEWILT
jgi:NADP-reducing hydrogenase subunit HndB